MSEIQCDCPTYKEEWGTSIVHRTDCKKAAALLAIQERNKILNIPAGLQAARPG